MINGAQNSLVLSSARSCRCPRLATLIRRCLDGSEGRLSRHRLARRRQPFDEPLYCLDALRFHKSVLFGLDSDLALICRTRSRRPTNSNRCPATSPLCAA
ncbi:hypothetical protein CBM2637_B120040 [Cupriavidus taiwanensis]|nr:hypothetical protein CBM2637_B120040 [Cupriavidus taiwanensis]